MKRLGNTFALIRINQNDPRTNEGGFMKDIGFRNYVVNFPTGAYPIIINPKANSHISVQSEEELQQLFGALLQMFKQIGTFQLQPTEKE
jgi:hypothetical protein